MRHLEGRLTVGRKKKDYRSWRKAGIRQRGEGGRVRERKQEKNKLDERTVGKNRQKRVAGSRREGQE